MPPSGFIKKETANLASFAESLLGRFEKEVSEGIHENVEQGIKKELLIIEDHLQKTNYVERGVLLLCKNIYLAYQETSSQEISETIRRLKDKDYKAVH